MTIAINSGVTKALGFRAAGVSAGIKKHSGQGDPPLDLAVIVSDRPASAAAVFTTNRAQAAPVTVSRRNLEQSHGTARAIVVNSGCANACTGDDGLAAAVEMGAETARLLGCPAEQVLVASTGVIGVSLPIDKLRAALPRAIGALGTDQGAAAARAIMTTDPFPKESSAHVIAPGTSIAVGGMCKGSGMIEPMLATMLAFLTTDAAISPALLDRAVREAVDETFNAITVDGECSTNDSVIVLANGASGVSIEDETSYALFTDALKSVCRELALGIVRGGEGATKLVRVNVTGAATAAEARRAAKAIANSPLVKTAVHGADPNWGRLIAVAGRAQVAFELSRASVSIGSIVLFANGQPYDEAAPRAAEHLQGKEVELTVDLGAGNGSSVVWTCDLSAEYVRINADYRT
jgi:glutamate N-acetyltransferase/amino-acid N-acetyltransferase